nr:hypothetical protein BaRGS_002551 [Batillaria attramentaria]
MEMAGVMDRFKKKKPGQTPEWSRNGSFLNKPDVGWIHPDQQLNPDAGICYGVRVDKRVSRMLGENPHMHYAGANVNLTITTDSINLMVMETGEETLDFVSYVAKDPALGRACHVLECGGGLAEDVVTTIGQAFELRFKQYLKKQPKALQLPDRRENPGFESESKWGEEEEYYNDRPGACPPSPTPGDPAPAIPQLPEYNSPCNVPVGTYMSVKDREDGVYSEAKERTLNLIDFSETNGQTYDNPLGRKGDNEQRGAEFDNVYDNRKGVGATEDATTENGLEVDPFDLETLVSSLGESKSDGATLIAETNIDAGADMADGGSDVVEEGAAAAGEVDLRKNPYAPTEGPSAPVFEEWYHGKITRKDSEKLLELDGDFLVRESSNKSTQFVLSGKQNGHVRHLLLVDPEGIMDFENFLL